MRALMETAHNSAHGYIGGTLGDPHASFRDPIVFLLHSNVDRIFAMWQAQPGASWRLDPNQVYGSEGISPAILENLQPWAGGGSGHPATRPWAPPENEQVVKDSRHPSVVAPPCYDTLPTNVEVLEAENPGGVIHFNDVPTGETAARAAVFHVWGCGSVTLRVKPGTEPVAPYSVLTPGGVVVVPRTLTPYTEARMWFGFLGQAPGPGPAGGVTIHCDENGLDYPFTFESNSIDRPTVAVELALDQSGSMDELAGTTGAHRIDVLRESAAQFVEVIQPQNGVGVIRFDTDAYPVNDANWPGLAMTRIGGAGMLDPGRVAARTTVQNHRTNPSGATSIGDGVALARTELNGVPPADYDAKAIIVFTDGLENRPESIASVMSSIDTRTFAIGLGTETQVSTAALKALTNGTGGYLLLTGHLSASVDSYFRLTKYFLQILAGVTNTSIVLDPTGSLTPGHKAQIPFQLSDSDIEVTVIALEDIRVLRMTLETPAGDTIGPAAAAAAGDVYVDGTSMSYYRLTLPVPVGAVGAREGTWKAILGVDSAKYKKELSNLKRKDPERAARIQAHGVRYSLNVHALSNLRMEARLDQSGLEPGAKLTLHAVLTEYGMPVEQRATVTAEIESPDGTHSFLSMPESGPGVFETSLYASLAGIYRVTVRAGGLTLRDLPFTREQVLTGAVFQGGNGPFPFGGDDPKGEHERLCRLIHCLLRTPGVERLLKEHKLVEIKRCLEEYCQRETPETVRTSVPDKPAKKKEG
jgi:hypothetical protein